MEKIFEISKKECIVYENENENKKEKEKHAKKDSLIEFETLKLIFEKKSTLDQKNSYRGKINEFDKKMIIIEHGIKSQIKYSLENTFDRIHLLNRDFHFDNDLVDPTLLNISNIFKFDERLYKDMHHQEKKKNHNHHYDYEEFKKVMIFKNIIKNAKINDFGKILILFDENLTVQNFLELEKQFNYSVQNSTPWQMVFFTIDQEYYSGNHKDQIISFTNSFLNNKIDLDTKIYAIGIDKEIYNSIYQKINIIAKQTLYNPILCLGYYYRHQFINIHLLP